MKENPISIEALEILDAIDRRGSFAKAAEELNKATSAISYGVQKLEEQLDITVFQREGRRSVLTPAGRLILTEGRKILNSAILLAQKAKEMATGWEPLLRIAIDSTQSYTQVFQLLAEFMKDHDSLEIDIIECILSGGWEALEQDRVDLIIGSPGPVPLQKGYRAIPLPLTEMIPVIASHHPFAKRAHNADALTSALPQLRRVVAHDTSTVNITRSAGLMVGKQVIYVQTIDQKIAAQLAGLGIGHLPKHRIQPYLDNGQFIELKLETASIESFLAWKISNKGKALQAFTHLLTSKLLTGHTS
ncbi:MAG: DNA-binding transcriptional LysR family regulator [Pseudohongiellaceae bacterium]|jgi:DNA-binding transcriptional LysR family regulator